VVVAFVPSAGGVGNATLVTEIGVWLKTNKGTKDRRVCIVDLDFQTSHVCDHLDIEPHLQIHDISSNPERFDAQLCETFTTHHSSGLDVFAAPRSRINVSELNVAALDALFDRIATRYDQILIDLPVGWFAWTPDILANADAVVVSGINTIPCLRQIAEVLATVRSSRSDTSQIAVVINRYEPTMIGGVARRNHVESVLRDERVFYVRDDLSAMAESLNIGAPMVLNSASRKTAREIVAIAAFCAKFKSIRAASA
jgi:pilus assembly protein CpaE